MKNKIRLPSLLSWLFSLIAFVSLLVWMNKVGDKLSLYQTLVNIWLGDIAFGVISFIVFISTYSKSKLEITGVDMKQKLVGISFWSWLSSILFFVLFLIMIGVKGWNFQNPIVGGVVIGDIVFGVLSCLTFFISVILTRGRSTVKKKGRNKSSLSKFFLYSTIIFLLLLSIGLSLQNRMEMNAKKETSKVEPTIIKQPTATPTVYLSQTNNSVVESNKIDCVGPDDKEFKTTMEECTKLNVQWGKSVNYMVDCKIHADCGGGVIRMSKIQCDKPCSGLPIPNTNQKTQNITVTSQKNFYCYDNVNKFSYYTTSGEQCNKDNEVSLCLNSAKVFTYSPCMDRCLQIANDASSYCIYNTADAYQTECLAKKQTEHQQCMDACGVIYQSETKKCY